MARRLDETGDASSDASEGYIAFLAAGDVAKGEFQCSECGYGVTIHRVLPICPMCAGRSWEQIPWSPLGRATTRLGGTSRR